MSIFGSLEGMASQAISGGNQEGKVAGGFLQALQEHPGGLGSVLDSFRNNGMGDHANAMANGEQPPTTPDQVQTGLNGTGLIEQTAQRAGVSPEMVKVGLAVALPMIMAHFSQNGQNPQNVGSGGMGGLAGSFLSRYL